MMTPVAKARRKGAQNTLKNSMTLWHWKISIFQFLEPGKLLKVKGETSHFGAMEPGNILKTRQM